MGCINSTPIVPGSLRKAWRGANSPLHPLNGCAHVSVHGSCPDCHHFHKNRPFTFSLDPTMHTRFSCENCGRDIFGIGRSNTQFSLASVESQQRLLDTQICVDRSLPQWEAHENRLAGLPLQEPLVTIGRQSSVVHVESPSYIRRATSAASMDNEVRGRLDTINPSGQPYVSSNSIVQAPQPRQDSPPLFSWERINILCDEVRQHVCSGLTARNNQPSSPSNQVTGLAGGNSAETSSGTAAHRAPDEAMNVRSLAPPTSRILPTRSLGNQASNPATAPNLCPNQSDSDPPVEPAEREIYLSNIRREKTEKRKANSRVECECSPSCHCNPESSGEPRVVNAESGPASETPPQPPDESSSTHHPRNDTHSMHILGIGDQFALSTSNVDGNPNSSRDQHSLQVSLMRGPHSSLSISSTPSNVDSNVETPLPNSEDAVSLSTSDGNSNHTDNVNFGPRVSIGDSGELANRFGYPTSNANRQESPQSHFLADGTDLLPDSPSRNDPTEEENGDVTPTQTRHQANHVQDQHPFLHPDRP